jgi:FMN phosphatase YigB (HAD superfamily)
MALTLDQYIEYLETRNLPWPAPPVVSPPRAKPHLVRLPGIRIVTWDPYGTLLAIAGGELQFELPDRFIMEMALEKTVQEFKMWPSMTRKPGQPSEYFLTMYQNELHQQRMMGGQGERHGEVRSDRVWQELIKKLLQKGYQFDAGFYGSLNEFSCKVAYFFHASLQAATGFPGAAQAIRCVETRGCRQGLLGTGQCFTRAQLRWNLQRQDRQLKNGAALDAGLGGLSCEIGVRPPSKRLFEQCLEALAQEEISPAQVLHVGSWLASDIVPARRAGMRTALFAGDRASTDASVEMFARPGHRPDVLLTELTQIGEILN